MYESLPLRPWPLTFAPLGVFFLTHPDTFGVRITQVASSTWQDALRGIGLCLQGLVLPGAGDPYIRFNLPGRPMLTRSSHYWRGSDWSVCSHTARAGRYRARVRA